MVYENSPTKPKPSPEKKKKKKKTSLQQGGSSGNAEGLPVVGSDLSDGDISSPRLSPCCPGQVEITTQAKEWEQEAQEFQTNFDNMAQPQKIPRFPPSLQGLDSKLYIAPMAVAIGPYYHSDDSDRLKEMQKVKKVAAHHFVTAYLRDLFQKKNSDGQLPSENMTFEQFQKVHFEVALQEMYADVKEAVGTASKFYASKEVEGIDNENFAFMMFIDGCFLLQYMLMCTDRENMDKSLLSFLKTNQTVISNDIILLENQLPWVVLETLRTFVDVQVEEFVAKMGRTLQVRADMVQEPIDDLNMYTNPPHLLGLLRFYKTGCHTNELSLDVNDGLKPMSKTTSAIELAEIGIGLKASQTAKFNDMGINKSPPFSNIFLAPLLLDQVRSSWLVNMAAFEVCMGMGTGLGTHGTEKPVVCSYLAVIAMLMDREKDVHKLRAEGIVQGELTNKEVLTFFKTIIKHINGGPLHIRIMEEVEDYKLKWWMWIVVYKFFYKNWKTIAAVLSAIGVAAGIFKMR